MVRRKLLYCNEIETQYGFQFYDVKYNNMKHYISDCRRGIVWFAEFVDTLYTQL